MKIIKIIIEPRFIDLSESEFKIEITTACGCGFVVARDTVEELVSKLPGLVDFIQSKTDFAEIVSYVCRRDL